jgi:hypothetical protein
MARRYRRFPEMATKTPHPSTRTSPSPRTSPAGNQNSFQVDATEEASLFRDDVLSHYDVVIWMSTTGDVIELSRPVVARRPGGERITWARGSARHRGAMGEEPRPLMSLLAGFSPA